MSIKWLAEQIGKYNFFKEKEKPPRFVPNHKIENIIRLKIKTKKNNISKFQKVYFNEDREKQKRFYLIENEQNFKFDGVGLELDKLNVNDDPEPDENDDPELDKTDLEIYKENTIKTYKLHKRIDLDKIFQLLDNNR